MPSTLFTRLFRTQKIAEVGDLQTPLKRCLTTFDLTVMGIAHMIGAGIYVLAGTVLKNVAGPSVVVSFMLSGFAALLCALCYAEFGARFPKAGSAYTYTYVGCGEIWAFIVGWNIVLEHLIHAATLSRSLSNYIDSLANGAISNYTMETLGTMGGEGSMIARYPDLLAFFLPILAAFAVATGPKAAARFIAIFSTSNLVVIAVVVIYGSTFIDFSNWTGHIANGNTRFMPYGLEGTLSGAAIVFFSYIGFEGLATAGEEAKDPSKSVPRATVLAMTIATSAYVLMSAVLSFMEPYENVHPATAIPDAFAHHGAAWAKYVVAVGAICGMTCALMGALFALPRCVYAMASDGLIFSLWSRVHPSTRTPVCAAIPFTFLVCVTALIFDVDALVEFMSIGTLVAYTVVSASIIVLRYRADDEQPGDRGGQLRVSLPVCSSLSPDRRIIACVVSMIVSYFVIGFLIKTSAARQPVGMAFAVIAAVVAIFITIFLAFHYQNTIKLSFKVPLVPFVPALSVFLNILMMTQLSDLTWIRFVVWMTIGLTIYFAYGIRHSKENAKRAVGDSAPIRYDAKQEHVDDSEFREL